MDTEAKVRKALAENYRGQAALMREFAATARDERARAECIDLAVKWELLAKKADESS